MQSCSFNFHNSLALSEVSVQTLHSWMKKCHFMTLSYHMVIGPHLLFSCTCLCTLYRLKSGIILRRLIERSRGHSTFARALCRLAKQAGKKARSAFMDEKNNNWTTFDINSYRLSRESLTRWVQQMTWNIFAPK